MDKTRDKDNFKDLYSREAVEKLKELAEDIKTCMFCTELGMRPIPCKAHGCEGSG